MLERFAVALPDGLHNTNVGNIVADSLPLTSMLCCLPTLTLFWRSGRLFDLVVLCIGFTLACIYHVCHMAPEGLVASKVLGVSGPVWRSLDVLFAQWLLGRTFGHAVAATHSLPVGVTNAAFPALLLHRGLAGDPLSVPACARALAATLAATLACKLVVEGAASLPRFPVSRGFSTAALFVAALVAFPMPELFPRHYWLFHSLWHAFLGAGYYELYAMLEDQPRAHAGRPVSRKGNSPAATSEEPSMTACKRSCSTKFPRTAHQTAHIVARSGTSGDSFAPRMQTWRRREPQSREADVLVQGHGRPLERAASGSVPWQQAQRLMVFSRSLKRLARFVCLHS
ncbi:g5112 [Coccomyxa elongata]